MLFETRRQLLKGAASIAGGLALGAFAAPAGANALRVGAAAPPATLVRLDGERITTQELSGQVIILTFWATWCVPCRLELPLLSDYAARHAPQGLRVLGFSLDTPDRLPQVAAIARTLSFPNGLFASSNAPGYGRMWKLPVNFTIGRDGRLVNDGWREKEPAWTAERLERVVTPLL